jgi:hypothetical protein
VKRVFVVAAVMLLLAGCSGKAEEVNACVERGVEYFKEIGSYPTLSSDPNKGRKAEDVARERCDRTTTAF